MFCIYNIVSDMRKSSFRNLKETVSSTCRHCSATTGIEGEREYGTREILFYC